MLEITSSNYLALSDEIVLQALPELEQYYAFNVDSGDQFQLNSTSYWILHQIGKGINLTELINKFSNEFEISPDGAMQDIQEILIFAKNNNIITWRQT